MGSYFEAGRRIRSIGAQSWCRCGWGEPSPGADVAGSPELRYRRDRRFELFGVDISAMTVDVLSLLPADIPLIFVAQEFWAVARCA